MVFLGSQGERMGGLKGEVGDCWPRLLIQVFSGIFSLSHVNSQSLLLLVLFSLFPAPRFRAWLLAPATFLFLLFSYVVCWRWIKKVVGSGDCSRVQFDLAYVPYYVL